MFFLFVQKQAGVTSHINTILQKNKMTSPIQTRLTSVWFVMSLLLFGLFSTSALLASRTFDNSLPFQLIKLQELFQGLVKPSCSLTKLLSRKPIDSEPSTPIWPLQFNCTLAKITPFNHEIQWTKPLL